MNEYLYPCPRRCASTSGCDACRIAHSHPVEKNYLDTSCTKCGKTHKGSPCDIFEAQDTVENNYRDSSCHTCGHIPNSEKHLCDQSQGWEEEFLTRFKSSIDNVGTLKVDAANVMYFITQLLSRTESENVRRLEEMKDVCWIVHERDCEEGRRPCGAVDHPEPLADRCYEQCYDNTTIDTAIRLLQSKETERGRLSEDA